jgi:spore germination protein YaaH
MTIQAWTRTALGALLFVLVATARAQSSPARYWGFTAPWDDRSTESVQRHDAALGAVISAWIGIDSATGMPSLLFPDETPRGPAPRFAMVTTALEGRFHPDAVRLLGNDSARASRAADSVGRILMRGRYQGLVIDFEELKAADTSAYLATVRALTRAAHKYHIAPVTVTIVGFDSVAYPVRRLLAAADRVMVMAYDQHWQTAPPGPIASPDWVADMVKRRLAEAGAGRSRVTVALPVYGYRWPAHGAATVVGYDEAKKYSLVRDSASLNLRATLRDSAQVWVCDAVTLDTLAKRVRALGPRTLAIWRLGLEDPKMWP